MPAAIRVGHLAGLGAVGAAVGELDRRHDALAGARAQVVAPAPQLGVMHHLVGHTRLVQCLAHLRARMGPFDPHEVAAVQRDLFHGAPLGISSIRLRYRFPVPPNYAELAATGRALDPQECADLARAAAELVDTAALERDGAGSFELLWRNEHSEAWLNTWWESRDTGFHDHGGSCVGVHVIEGRAANEALTVGGPRHILSYGPGDSFAFRADGIHRMDHEAGAVTVHVYSPRSRRSGTTSWSMASCGAPRARPTRDPRRARGCTRRSARPESGVGRRGMAPICVAERRLPGAIRAGARAPRGCGAARRAAAGPARQPAAGSTDPPSHRSSAGARGGCRATRGSTPDGKVVSYAQRRAKYLRSGGFNRIFAGRFPELHRIPKQV